MNGSLPVSGFLCVDKPLGVTSFDVVAAFRHATGIRKVGHAGTLDPQASGLLLLGYGQGTRLLRYLAGETKIYRTVIRLGARTTTDDSEGNLLEQGHADAVARRVRQLVPETIAQTIREHFIGTIQQVPSAYSAVRVDGRHAYDLARRGRNVRLKARSIVISAFKLGKPRFVTAAKANADFALSANPVNQVPADAPDEVLFCDVPAVITCSAGTYIRSLGRDLGEVLGVGGYLTSLRRTAIGDFSVAGAIPMKAERYFFQNCRTGETSWRSRAVVDADKLAPAVISLAAVARRVMPSVEVDDAQARDLRSGRWVAYADVPPLAYDDSTHSMDSRTVASSSTAGSTAVIHRVNTREELIAVVKADSQRFAWRPVTVFPQE
ncbi:MAG: tRNA pseudouridine(55) synthase TruB [Aeriscardovia sp.]|nr:tRNA pseudouridine(55) synthase TruB [Aeriscardovia sp.]